MEPTTDQSKAISEKIKVYLRANASAMRTQDVQFMEGIAEELLRTFKPGINPMMSSSSTQLVRHQEVKETPQEPAVQPTGLTLTLCYSEHTGRSMALDLEVHLKAKGVAVTMICCPDIATKSFQDEADEMIKNTQKFALLLTPGVLELSSAKYVCRRVLEANMRIILAQDQQFPFPSVDQQPEFMRKEEVFNDKAIPYLAQYGSTTANQLVTKIQKKKEIENIDTRAFLSHKRSSAQGMAGRLYEGLKGWRVFLDSEAEFDLHDLQLIVVHTRVFIFILSEGIFDSFWCMEELRAAVKAGKRILIIKASGFKIPEPLPPQVVDLADTLHKSPTLDYIAEFFKDCVERIKAFLGPSDADIKELEEKNPEFVNQVKEKRADVDMDLYFSSKISMKTLESALESYYIYPPENIRSLAIRAVAGSEMTDQTLVSKLTPKLKSFLANDAKLTDVSMKYLGENATKLENITLINNTVTDRGLIQLLRDMRCLKLIKLGTLPNVTCSFLEELVTSCPELKTLQMELNGLTNDKLAYVAQMTQLENISLRFSKGITDDGLKFLVSCRNVTELDLDYVAFTEASVVPLCESMKKLRYLSISMKAATDACLKTIAENCPHLATLEVSNSSITDQGLKYISEGVGKDSLKSINMVSCKGVTDQGIIHLANGCHNLESLNIGNTVVSDAGLKALKEGCPNIKKIKAPRARSITEAGKSLFDKEVWNTAN